MITYRPAPGHGNRSRLAGLVGRTVHRAGRLPGREDKDLDDEYCRPGDQRPADRTRQPRRLGAELTPEQWPARRRCVRVDDRPGAQPPGQRRRDRPGRPGGIADGRAGAGIGFQPVRVGSLECHGAAGAGRRFRQGQRGTGAAVRGPGRADPRRRPGSSWPSCRSRSISRRRPASGSTSSPCTPGTSRSGWMTPPPSPRRPLSCCSMSRRTCSAGSASPGRSWVADGRRARADHRSGKGFRFADRREGGAGRPSRGRRRELRCRRRAGCGWSVGGSPGPHAGRCVRVRCGHPRRAAADLPRVLTSWLDDSDRRTRDRRRRTIGSRVSTARSNVVPARGDAAMSEAGSPTPEWPTRDRLWRGLQPGAVAGRDLGTGRRADARRGRDGRDGGRFCLGEVATRPGAWDDGWLRRVLDLLHRNGIAVDLATATASPPPWLVRAHPEIRPVDARGTRLEIGSRQTWCPSSPVFREHSLALVRELPDAVRRPSGGRHVARLERAGQSQWQLLLRGQSAALPVLAASPVRRCRDAEPAVGHGVLEPALLVLRRDRRSGRDHGLPEPWAAAGLATKQVLGRPPRRCRGLAVGRPTIERIDS